jgi:FtsP/CotA-like multicopper oxidase with cupredoxin domain
VSIDSKQTRSNFYRDNSIPIRVGELIRIYFINALEFDPINSFHLHANFFKVYRTGSKLTADDYTDIVTLSQAERCIIEFAYTLPGIYMFHAHQNSFAELGWMGHFEVW